ncbi:iron chaperone [Flavobacterium sp. 5]|uniref:iron chaperone n=1 Tax=Flavobacterium sp. 5 TaxID=2035199 RepID=UPI003517B589
MQLIKNYIGFYATPKGHTEFANELSKYKQDKGSVQFPINQPIPYELIERIVIFRVKENE